MAAFFVVLADAEGFPDALRLANLGFGEIVYLVRFQPSGALVVLALLLLELLAQGVGPVFDFIFANPFELAPALE